MNFHFFPVKGKHFYRLSSKMTLDLDSLHPETQLFPLPLGGGSCEKIRFADKISFSRCPGAGKIRAAKIGGTGRNDP